MNSSRISPFHLSLFAVVVALLFSLLIYQQIASPLDNMLSGDGHDRLGFGLYHDRTLSFYPSTEPTVMRGPVYPLLVAFSLLPGTGFYPWPLIFLQAILHGLTVLLTCRIAQMLTFSHKRMLLCGLIAALHPFLLWYVGRVIVEPLSIVLFTLTSYTLLVAGTRPSTRSYLWLGLTLGVATLTKGVYLAPALATPLLLLISRKGSKDRLQFPVARLLLIPLATFALVVPWTIRNYRLTGAIIPVHILDGVNFAVGDHFAEGFASSPLAYAPIINTFVYPDYGSDGVKYLMEADAVETVEYDRQLRDRSLERYRHDPSFLLKKMGLQAFTFWTLGSRKIVTIVIGGMQLLLLLLTIRGGIGITRRDRLFSPLMLPLWLALLYFIVHLPLYAIGRFSVVLVPTMIAYGIGCFRKEESLRRSPD